MGVTALAVVRLRNLFAVVMLSGIFSLLAAALFLVLDAVDVSLTEAAVGAGIVTVLMLGTLALTTREEKPPAHRPLLPLAVVVVTGAALVYGTLDMPAHGDPEAPIHQHVAPEYLADAVPQYGVPVRIGIANVVTNTLASYRGYDTLGEVAVIFTAAIGVMVLMGLGRRRGRPRRPDRDAPPAPEPRP